MSVNGLGFSSHRMLNSNEFSRGRDKGHDGRRPGDESNVV
jgi:hypothetical protein